VVPLHLKHLCNFQWLGPLLALALVRVGSTAPARYCTVRNYRWLVAVVATCPPPFVVLAAVLSDSLRGGRRCMLHVRRPSTTTAPKTTGNLLLLDRPCRGRPYVPEI
jgi:hypothetical protein